MTTPRDTKALLERARRFLDHDFDHYTATDAGTHWMPLLMSALAARERELEAARADTRRLDALDALRLYWQHSAGWNQVVGERSTNEPGEYLNSARALADAALSRDLGLT